MDLPQNIPENIKGLERTCLIAFGVVPFNKKYLPKLNSELRKYKLTIRGINSVENAIFTLYEVGKGTTILKVKYGKQTKMGYYIGSGTGDTLCQLALEFIKTYHEGNSSCI